MTNTIPKRGDVFFCQGSPDAIGSEERKTRPVVIIQNDAGNASSPTVIVANMTTNTSRRPRKPPTARQKPRTTYSTN